MVGYKDFVRLSQSSDSEERGGAAHMAAMAYLGHQGPADEQAALYASLIGFLDDPSVKVRAALAYGLLHAADAPRPIMLALLHDSAVISRAVVQYSPVLIDADIVGLVREFDLPMLLAVCQRSAISERLASALIARGEQPVSLRVLRRADAAVGAALLQQLAEREGHDADMRGALLMRRELPAAIRALVVQKAVEALAGARIVKGALASDRLARVLRNSRDTALSAIGEREAVKAQTGFAADLIVSDRLNTRLLLHAVVTGHVMFFADCLAELGQTPRDKVFSLLENGSRPALNAMLGRCGLGEGMRLLFVKLVMHARAADLADDAAARHYVVTALTEELIVDHAGAIPNELEEAFAYLSEQNVQLARRAARGVMAAFAGTADKRMALPSIVDDRLALPAA
ncbi:DUF2336 domain-containing protein [uncultured Devosia sp.]|uniref:DUF2336 domain-containing protein n=1 Tax=uncultured Devosia sp. TaxID=211434 RepID=UPI0035CB2548